MQDFFADIIQNTTGGLTYITLPFNAKEVFHKSKGTLFVSGTINNVSYRSKLISRGSGKYIMTLDKTLQKSIGFNGDVITVHVTMIADDVTSVNEREQDPITATSNIDVLTAIKTRQSIRKFTTKPINQELINTILCAGLHAPTAKNKRPYHFIVIRNRQLLSELANSNSNAFMLDIAPCAVVVCGDKNIEGMKEMLYSDCAAATQNMLLAIYGLGLGGVWCGVVAKSDWQKLLIERLALPLKLEPIAVIAFGYPDEAKELSPRWEPHKIHYEKW